MAFTFFDYGVAFILVASALIGVLRGLVREVLALVGWVVAFVLAYHFGGMAAKWMPEALPGGELTRSALRVLDNNANGFFLMVENKLTDSSSHDHNLQRNIYEVRELERAVQQAISWAAGRTDTLILVAADHETGGLSITNNNGAGALPSASWSSGGHSTAQVPVFASGANAYRFAGALDNTDISRLILEPTDSLLQTPDAGRQVPVDDSVGEMEIEALLARGAEHGDGRSGARGESLRCGIAVSTVEDLYRFCGA